MLKYIFSILSFMVGIVSFSNGQNLHNIPADKIIATLGSRYILMSEVDNYFAQYKANNDTVGPEMKCEIMYLFMVQKILSEQALRDSIIVSEAEVEMHLEDRLQKFIRQFGSKEQLEATLGKSVYQIKDDFRDEIREQLTAEQVKDVVNRSVVVTPEEVKNAFNDIEKDEIPYINASVEVGQIIVNPKASQEIEDYTRNKLLEVREQIVEGGKDFATMAGISSEDPGSRDNGGFFVMDKQDTDPMFYSAAMRLKNGEVSPVIRSSFGYHIIKMERRLGNTKAEVRHILMIPAITSIDMAEAQKILDSVKVLLDEGKMTYAEAITKISNDELAKGRSGMMFDFNTGNTKITLDLIDHLTARYLQNMEIGQYSEPHVFDNPYKRNAQAMRILYLKNRIDPHVANLDQDYTLFQNYTKRIKQDEELKKYVLECAQTIHLRLDPAYKDCENLKPFYDIIEDNKK